jgi:hypothetical protein
MKLTLSRWSAIGFILGLLTIAVGCLDSPPDPDSKGNPVLHPKDPIIAEKDPEKFEPPRIVMGDGPISNGTWYSDTVVFSWTSPDTAVVDKFFWQMDDDQTEETAEMSAEIFNLDEGSHLFTLGGRYKNGAETPDTRLTRVPFTVKYNGPVVYLSPREVTVSPDSEFDLLLKASGFGEIPKGMQVVLTLPNRVSLEAYETLDFLEINDTTTFAVARLDGNELTYEVARPGGFSNLSDAGSIARIRLKVGRVETGPESISVKEILMFDENNLEYDKTAGNMVLKESLGTVLTVKEVR